MTDIESTIGRAIFGHGWLMDDTTPDEMRAQLKSAAFMIYDLRERLGDWEDVASAQAAALREVSERWGLDDREMQSVHECAVEGAAWQLLELTGDTADRSPSLDDVNAARVDARRLVDPLSTYTPTTEGNE